MSGPVRNRALKRIASFTIFVLGLLALVLAAAAWDAERQLSLLVRKPAQACSSSGPRPSKPLEAIRQWQVDNGLVQHFLRERGIAHRYAFIFAYRAYALALPMLASTAERRALFAKLPCGIRPRRLQAIGG